MTKKVTVPYPYDPADVGLVELAVGRPSRAPADGWVPALRDNVSGRSVAWARVPNAADLDHPTRGRVVWLRDQHGARQVDQL
jgi:hypothetical protein